MNPVDIAQETLTEIVQVALAAPAVRVTTWQMRPLVHRVINRVTGGVYRVAGTAQDHQQSFTWSLVLKVLHCPDHDPASDFNASAVPMHWNYWRREALVYASELLAHMPLALAAPRCFAIAEPTPDVAYLWIEDIQGIPATQWPLERFELAAKHLGQFQGAYLAASSLPDAPWLSRRWLRAWVATEETVYLDLIRDEMAWRHPLLVGVFPADLQDAVLRLWEDHPALLEAIEQLPQTLCHLDLWPPNMFARTTAAGEAQTVLIDWSQIGYGAPAEDIANLVLDSVWMFKIPPDALPAYEQYVWNGYIAGLRAAGWQGDEAQVRFVYAAAAALRFGLLAGRLLQAANDESAHAELEQRYHRTMREIIGPRAAAVRHALELGREARV
jgi:hypothetical protein